VDALKRQRIRYLDEVKEVSQVRRKEPELQNLQSQISGLETRLKYSKRDREVTVSLCVVGRMGVAGGWVWLEDGCDYVKGCVDQCVCVERICIWRRKNDSYRDKISSLAPFHPSLPTPFIPSLLLPPPSLSPSSSLPPSLLPSLPPSLPPSFPSSQFRWNRASLRTAEKWS